MILTAQDRNALMEAIEVIQAVQNRRPIVPNPSTRHILITLLQRSIQEESSHKSSHKTKSEGGIRHARAEYHR